METRLLKGEPNNYCDYLLISLDDQSFSYLNDGNPVRVAFFIDDNEHLPWYQRKTMVAIIGKNLDFNKYKIYKNGIFKRGLVDKSYLIDYINKMKKKLIQMALQELEAIDISNTIEAIPEAKALEEPEYLNTAEASKILNISPRSLLNLIKKRKIKGERDKGSGWSFLKSDIERVLKEEPEFITKIWNDHKSIKRRIK